MLRALVFFTAAQKKTAFLSVTLGSSKNGTKQGFMQNIRSNTGQTQLLKVEQSATKDTATYI